MSDIIKFDFEGKRVRTIDRDGLPEFIAKDVCAVLGLDNARQAVRSLDDDEKGKTTLLERGVTNNDVVTNPGTYNTYNTVTQAGLFRLIFKSRKPVAKRFQRFVFHEVLPMIRERGYYVRKGDEARVVDALKSELTAMRAEMVAERNERLHLLRMVAARPWGLLGDGAVELLARIRKLRDALIREGSEAGPLRAVQKTLDNRIRREVDYTAGAWQNCPAEKANAAHSYISREEAALQRRAKRKAKRKQTQPHLSLL